MDSWEVCSSSVLELRCHECEPRGALWPVLHRMTIDRQYEVDIYDVVLTTNIVTWGGISYSIPL